MGHEPEEVEEGEKKKNRRESGWRVPKGPSALSIEERITIKRGGVKIGNV